MLDSPLLETLRQFTQEELLLLDKFVHSKLFYYPDNASGVIALFEQLLPYAPHFDNVNALNRQELAKKLNKTPQYILKTASGLHTVVRKFIAWHFNDYTNNTFSEQVALLSFYKKKGLNTRFETLFAKIEAEVNKKTDAISPEVYGQRYRLNALKFDWIADNNPKTDLNLLATLDSFESYYLLRKAQLTYNLVLRNINFSMPIEPYIHILNDIERFCRSLTAEIQGLLLLYYEAILLLTEQVEADFERFQVLLGNYESVLSPKDFQSLHGLERQYLLTQFNKGNISLLQRVFQVYKNHLEKGLLYHDGVLLPFTFSNIVRYGCRAGDLEWVEQFLKDYEHRISGTARPKELFRLYSAYFFLYKNRLKEAEDNLVAEFEDPITRVDARCLELMVFYSTQSDLLDYKVESFRKLVRNTAELPEVRRGGFHNFALILRKMLNPDLKRNNKKIDKLIEDIKSEPTSEAMWLIVQLEKLKKRH